MDSRPLKTLDRVLSKAGIGSRTETRRWIGEGRIQVNGQTIRTPDHWVDLASDKVTFDGKPIEPAHKAYLLLYKPKGYLTTYKDPEGRPTVYDLLGGVSQYVVPVGRLDLDTSGLLLLTNDTAFAERVMNPDSKVPKTYLVKAAGPLNEEQVQKLRQGVELDDGPTRPAEVTPLRQDAAKSFLEITITEGRNRQVRRMLEAVGSRVRKLVRTAIGPIAIGKLEIGKYRALMPEEVDRLAGPGWFKRATSRPVLPPPPARARAAADTPGGRAVRKRPAGDGREPAAFPKRRSPVGGRSAGPRQARPESGRSAPRDDRPSRGSTPGGRGTARSGRAATTERPRRPGGRAK